MSEDHSKEVDKSLTSIDKEIYQLAQYGRRERMKSSAFLLP